MKRFAAREGVLLLGLVVCSVHAGPPVGLANQAYPEEDVFEVISQRRSMGRYDSQFDDSGWVDNPTYAVLMNGYVAMAGKDALSFFDVSDPYNTPKVVATHRFSPRKQTIENDGWGFTTGYGGVHAAVMDTNFLEIWDYADHTNPVHVGTVSLPYPHNPGDLEPRRGGFGFPIGVAWQAPYLYSSMRNVGIDIIDVHDPANPEAVHRLDAGFGQGNIQVVGNLLITGNYNGRGIAIYDISDPTNPELLDSETKGDGASGWQVWVNGNKLFRSGERVEVWDISNPADMKHRSTFERDVECINHDPDGPSHGHCSSGGVDTQDGYLFFGGSYFGIFKWDLETETLIGKTGPYTKPGGDIENNHHHYDLDYPNVFGNLMVGASEDHYQGIFIAPHQAEPDNTPPEVNMVVPADGETNQAVTSRVGLTFTDAVDATSVSTGSVILREEGGDALPGKYSFYKSIVNFSPDEPLKTGTTYEVVVPAGGVTDYVGNATAATFTSRFSTGNVVSIPSHEPPGRATTHLRGTRLDVRFLSDRTSTESRYHENAQRCVYTIRGSKVPAQRAGLSSTQNSRISRGIYIVSSDK